MYYFGYKLVTISSVAGIPLIYDLVPANMDERQAAETLLEQLSGFHLFADKGFLGQAWQADALHIESPVACAGSARSPGGGAS